MSWRLVLVKLQTASQQFDYDKDSIAGVLLEILRCFFRSVFQKSTSGRLLLNKHPNLTISMTIVEL